LYLYLFKVDWGPQQTSNKAPIWGFVAGSLKTTSAYPEYS